MGKKELNKIRNLAQQLDIINTVTKIFNCIYYVDMKDYSFIELGVNLEGVEEVIGITGNAKDSFEQMYQHFVDPEYLEAMKEFTDLDTINERLKDTEWIAQQFFGPVGGWSEGIFIAANRDENGNCDHIIWATRNIDAAKRKEEILESRSNTDELTQLRNRRAYESAFDAYEASGIPEDLVYLSIDVNGLKNVNDTLGHAAGDELLIGAADCMRQSLAGYGELYRIGGDEFAALLHMEKTTMVEAMQALEEKSAAWSGKLVGGLSLSCGCVSRRDCPDATMQDIAIKADKRMYVSKAAYYKNRGVDRCGQKDAHIALCCLYTKILKINITNDTYQIMNMDPSEKVKEKGFAESIFSWLRGFGETGQVHSEDLEDYLKKTDPEYIRKYFKDGHIRLCLHYRRKSETGYRMAYMEMLPANDYSPKNQNLFLYVKEYPL